MGKSKSKGSNKNRLDSTTKAAKIPSDPELQQLREHQILPVLRDLQSPDLKARPVAARVIANICQDSKCRKLLLREQVVQILLEHTLPDLDSKTRASGWCVLRKLAFEEEVDFCVHLYRRDILSAIESASKLISQTIHSREPPVSNLPKAQQALLWDLTDSIIGLLSSLSEAQEIVEAITKSHDITNFLHMILFLDYTPLDVQNETLLCLAALTEDNDVFSKQVAENKVFLTRLLKIRNSTEITAVSACGVLHNIFMCMQWFDHNSPIVGASDGALISKLVEVMTGTHQSDGINGSQGSVSPHETLLLALDITASIATDIQEALEHGTSNRKKSKVVDDKMDADDDEPKTRDDGVDADSDMDMVLNDPSEEVGSIQEVTIERLVRDAAPQILRLAGPSSEATTNNEAVQSHALAALNNIAWTVSNIDFTASQYSSNFQEFWSSLVQQMWNELLTSVLSSNTADIELASTITSLAWALARSVRGAIKIQLGEQNKFMALYQASKSLENTSETTTQTNGSKKTTQATDPFQGLGVKCIGILSQLALSPAPIELNREIGMFLLTVLESPNTPPADAVEALNQLFDIYADNSYSYDEVVFWAGGFHGHLEQYLPKWRKMAKGIDKRRFTELRARADEAVINLARFLTYKKGERKKDGEK